MTCPSCRAALADDARFCPSCGARQPEEDAAGVLQYREALRSLAGRREAWAEAELAELRRELHIRPATHARLVAELAPPPVAAPVSLHVDASTLVSFRVGEQGLVRIRVLNESPRALRSVALRCVGSAEAATRVLGPGEDEVLSLLLRPSLAGHHAISGTVQVTPLRGEESCFELEEIAFRVAGAAALQQSIHIDARSQKVGIFENIGAAERGGLVSGADWRPVPLRAASAPSAPETAPLPPIGHRAPGVVVATGEGITMSLDGVSGALVDLEDPTLRGMLGPGDRLAVTVIGHDGRGGLLLSTRAPSAAPRGSTVRVGPADSLAEALRASPSRVVISGVHVGPFVVEHPVEIAGEGATLEAARGPVLRVAADVILRGLALRGAAPAGSYAVDALEIAAGRVVLERCTVASDATGNLTPGRAVAVTGPAQVELRDCAIQASGIGVAIDVAWSGFPTATASGAKVRVHGCTFTDVGTGVAVAGAGREVHVARSCFVRAADGAVRVLRGAAAIVEDCTVPSGALTAEPGSNIVQRGNHP